MPGLDIRVTGGTQLRSLALELHRQAATGLLREVDRSMRAAARDVEDEVRAHTDEYMPRGYEEPFRTSLRFRTEVRKTSEFRVTLSATGRGRSRLRDLRRLDEGGLRHPVFGRWRGGRARSGTWHRSRSPWVEQRIREGWFTEPATRSAPAVRIRITQALDRVAAKIEKAA